MTSIQILVQGAAAWGKTEGIVTAGAVGIPVTLQCSRDWDGLRKIIKFRCGEVEYQFEVVEGTAITVPWDCLLEGRRLEIALDGWDSAGTLRIPTNWVCCAMVQPSGTQGTEPPAPPQLLTQQLLEWAESTQEQLDRLPDISETEKKLEDLRQNVASQAAGLQEKVQLALAGDLQAQCTASSYAMRELGVPFAGLFGACSTMAEGLALGAALCESGAARALLAMASSHFCAAERQFRTPLSYGAVRTPTAQWTATAAGCCLLQPQGAGVGIAAAAFGRVQDYQVKDINNMGAAMAPAAASTLLHYFKDTNTEPQEFDCIYTGDLGQTGSQLLRELLAAEGLLVRNHVDCGCILFDPNEQRVKSGGSGPGCCASVLCGHILPRLEKGTQKRVLFIATGALMSQTTFLQKESIPAIAHLVELRSPQQKEENG